MGSLFLLGGVLTVSSSKAKPAEVEPDDITAFVTSVESKAADYEDTRITLGDGTSEEREWQEPRVVDGSDTYDIEMITAPKHLTLSSK